MGQVTAVVIVRSVAWAIAPIIVQTNGPALLGDPRMEVVGDPQT